MLLSRDVEVHRRVGGLSGEETESIRRTGTELALISPVIRLYWSSKAGHGPALSEVTEARGLRPVVSQHADARTAGPGAPVVQLAHGGGQTIEPVRHAGGVVAVTEDKPALARARPTAGVPDGGALEVHLLSVTEGVAALRTAGTGGMEVIVVSGLQHLPGYKPAHSQQSVNKSTKKFNKININRNAYLSWRNLLKLSKLPVTVGTPHPVLVMVASLTVRPTLVSHVLTVQEDGAG